MPKESKRQDDLGTVEEFLISRSNLTDAQVAVARSFTERKYLVSKEGRTRKYRIREGARAVSKGTFFRVLGQAKANVRRALYTILLLSFYEMIDERAIDNLIRTGFLLKEATQRESHIERDRLRQILQSVEENMAIETNNAFGKQ